MSIVWDVIKNSKKSKKIAELLRKFDSVLAISIDKKEERKIEIPDEIIKLAEERKIARENKNWEESDKLRQEISDRGYNIKDTKDGYQFI